MKKKKSRLKWVVLLVIVAVIGLWFLGLRRTSESVAYTQMTAQQGDLTTYYNFDGTVHAKRIQTVTAQAEDTVKTVYVNQNDPVKKGDRLYRTQNGTTVEAQIDGEVTGLYISEGDVITAGEKTAEIIDLDDLQVQLSVDEYDVAAMTPGNAVEVYVPARGLTFSGTVTALDKNGTASGDLSYYTAYVDLTQAQDIYPGMQVSAKILKAQAVGAVLLRADAIQFDAQNQPYVIMSAGEEGETKAVPIVVGMSDGVNCEILEGVIPGDTVLRPVTFGMPMMMMHIGE